MSGLEQPGPLIISKAALARLVDDAPESLRRYIYELETRADPAGDVQEIACLRDQRDALLAGSFARRIAKGDSMVFTLGNHNFRILFHHKTKLGEPGERRRLHQGSIKAVTTCVLIGTGPAFSGGEFYAIDNALCVDEDCFSRPFGCALSLKYLLDYNRSLAEFREALWEAYHRKVSGIEDCPTCFGHGWRQDEGYDGKACEECRPYIGALRAGIATPAAILRAEIIGGTGFKEGQMLFLAGRVRPPQMAAMVNAPELLIPIGIPTPKPAVPKLAEDEVLRLIARGAAKREARAHQAPPLVSDAQAGKKRNRKRRGAGG
jgi:hypothetical protein